MCLYWPCLVIRHDARTALGTTATWCLSAELQAWYLTVLPLEGAEVTSHLLICEAVTAGCTSSLFYLCLPAI